MNDRKKEEDLIFQNIDEKDRLLRQATQNHFRVKNLLELRDKAKVAGLSWNRLLDISIERGFILRVEDVWSGVGYLRIRLYLHREIAALQKSRGRSERFREIRQASL